MFKILSVAILAMLLALPVWAQDSGYVRNNYPPQPDRSNVYYAWANVLRVDPVYGLAQVRQPTQNCYPQRVVTEDHSNTAETLLGAVIGGALGHTMGQGNGRRAATIGGAIIGGVMGDRMGSRPQSSSQTRCRETRNESPRRRIIGYDIEYRYHGDIYMSRLNYDPGDRLRIRINITPAD